MLGALQTTEEDNCSPAPGELNAELKPGFLGDLTSPPAPKNLIAAAREPHVSDACGQGSAVVVTYEKSLGPGNEPFSQGNVLVGEQQTEHHRGLRQVMHHLVSHSWLQQD